mmetsp:Transcript_8539/g.22040  ORF Transcript_8539/g.22040 Transcript_8539/m.22040 type:complete len:344 (+) Transcript_8539:69-1100(+)
MRGWGARGDGSGTHAAGGCATACAELELAAVPSFLEPYGYSARSAQEWLPPLPVMCLSVKGHEEDGGHTLYHVDCQLSRAVPPKRATPAGWRCRPDVAPPLWHMECRTSVRLAQLRVGLHDLVKKQLGSAYGRHFHGIPFAHRGAPPGTTARLDAWCRRLAERINDKAFPPCLAAAALRFLRAPSPPSSADGARVVLDNSFFDHGIPTPPSPVASAAAAASPACLVAAAFADFDESVERRPGRRHSYTEQACGAPGNEMAQFFRMDDDDSGSDDEDSDDGLGEAFAALPPDTAEEVPSAPIARVAAFAEDVASASDYVGSNGSGNMWVEKDRARCSQRGIPVV